MGERKEITAALARVQELSFDVDVRVHVFELTIRALGALLWVPPKSKP